MLLMEEFIRTELIIGKEALEKMAKARVAFFGVGGVGGYAVEGLARTGIGTLDLIDNDDVALSNINRQIIATHSVVGRLKVEVDAECGHRSLAQQTQYRPQRQHSINPSRLVTGQQHKMKPALRYRHLKVFALELKGAQRHGYAYQYFLAIKDIGLHPFWIKNMDVPLAHSDQSRYVINDIGQHKD